MHDYMKRYDKKTMKTRETALYNHTYMHSTVGNLADIKFSDFSQNTVFLIWQVFNLAIQSLNQENNITTMTSAIW